MEGRNGYDSDGRGKAGPGEDQEDCGRPGGRKLHWNRHGRHMEEAADRWTDGIGREGEAAWAELKLQADAYRQHRRQRKVCSNLLQVLEKYGEEEEKGWEGQDEGSGTMHVSL